jgi:3-oxoacyl-[acyl-carrier protein] reductase
MKPDPSRIALVTGAARGIGLACAQGFLAKNYRVVAADRVPADPGVYAQYGANVRIERLDVTDRAAIEALRTSIENEWGTVSVLVNNAGISPKKPDGTSSGILEIDDLEWEKVIAVNLTTVLRMSQIFLPGMKRIKWGRIVNVSSLAGRAKSLVAGGSYMASKAGLLGLTRAIASEMGPLGITANAVAPGRILTEMAMQAGEDVNRRYAEQIPVRRLGTTDEVAAAILYLASVEAGFVNGALLDINGGFYMP